MTNRVKEFFASIKFEHIFAGIYFIIAVMAFIFNVLLDWIELLLNQVLWPKVSWFEISQFVDRTFLLPKIIIAFILYVVHLPITAINYLFDTAYQVSFSYFLSLDFYIEGEVFFISLVLWLIIGYTLKFAKEHTKFEY